MLRSQRQSRLVRPVPALAAVSLAAATALALAAPAAAAPTEGQQGGAAVGTSLIRPMPGTFPPGKAGADFPGLRLRVTYNDTDGDHAFPCAVGTVDDQQSCATTSPIPDGVVYTISPTGASKVPHGWLQPRPVTAT